MDQKKTAVYELGDEGKYNITNYDNGAAFSSFLPGLGGMEGVPLWCMYVNRGQAVVSFGVGNKDNAIAEFLPATWAYQLVGTQGFRTFCKVDGKYYEPFQKDQVSGSYDYSRSMSIEADRVTIEEINQSVGLSFKVEYFSPVNQPVGSLVRVVTVSNISSEKKSLKMLDGLALILPAGFTDFGIKAMRRINEAYASVGLVCGNVPFYSPKVLAHDEAEVIKVEKGNFYAAWTSKNGKLESVEPFVDPDVIFGGGNDLITPRRFMTEEKLDRAGQVWENRLPCALAPVEATLEAGESIQIVAVAGLAPNERIACEFLGRFDSTAYIDKLSAESREVVDGVTSPCMTVSRHCELDGYARQSYLDNVLRGGVPVMLPSKSGATPLHLYSRRHGDLERDYNFFELPPLPLSSGPGNYRDICQNRRADIWFYPELGDAEIKMFVALLQADGYNPLGIEGYKWVLPDGIDAGKMCPSTESRACEEFAKIMDSIFHPGALLDWANLYGVKIDNKLEWLNGILAKCKRKLVAGGHEGGYWIDHWFYITDLLESFAAIYPDKVVEMLDGPAEIGWFNEGAYVVPRDEKHLLRSNGPVQLHSVVDVEPVERKMPNVTVFGKLCALIAIKAISFDHKCCGIEMEAGRPSWDDAPNGLPGLFGSSTCEAAEIAIMADWLLQYLSDMPACEFPVEIADLIDEVIGDLGRDEYNWDRAATIREDFRKRISTSISGKKRVVSGDSLREMLEGASKRSKAAIDRSMDGDTGLAHTYFINEPVDVEKVVDEQTGDVLLRDGSPRLQIKSFAQKPLPLFLEGQVHLLRILDSTDDARDIYKAVKNSALLDESLEMYKLNECLAECPLEIGRLRTFTRGWFENESIWVHMSYKYLLELLRNGLYEEFFSDAETMLVPFMDPAVYGRSILENSSFIASSACPDANARGRGFVARLSGSTAEFIGIWLLLTVGKNPFYMVDGDLRFAVKPVLPGDWFTTESKTVSWQGENVEIEENCFGCALLGSILLVYHNDSRKDTFGSSSVKVSRYLIDGKDSIEAGSVETVIAEKIRQREVGRIDVWLE